MKKKIGLALALVFGLLCFQTAWAVETETAQTAEQAAEKTTETQAEAVPEEEPVVEEVEIEGTDYIPVLMYHHFAQRDMGEGNGVVTTQDELQEHIDYFKEQGYRIISLEDLDKLILRTENENKRLKRNKDKGLNLEFKYLCITMDDGYKSNYDVAFPVFQKNRVPASIFGVTDFITTNYGLQKFTWGQARKMEESGLVKIYSHTSNHKAFEEGQEAAYLESVAASQVTLKEQLSQKNKVQALAYPNGRYNQAVQEELKKMGFSLLFTVEHGVINRDTSRYSIPRIAIDSGMTGEDVVKKIEGAAKRTFGA